MSSTLGIEDVDADLDVDVDVAVDCRLPMWILIRNMGLFIGRIN